MLLQPVTEPIEALVWHHRDFSLLARSPSTPRNRWWMLQDMPRWTSSVIRIHFTLLILQSLPQRIFINSLEKLHNLNRPGIRNMTSSPPMNFLSLVDWNMEIDFLSFLWIQGGYPKDSEYFYFGKGKSINQVLRFIASNSYISSFPSQKNKTRIKSSVLELFYFFQLRLVLLKQKREMREGYLSFEFI